MTHKKKSKKSEVCMMCEANDNAIRYLTTALDFIPGHLEYTIKLVIRDLKEEMAGCK